MSNLYAESIDSSNNTVSTIFSSASFSFLPLFIPWIQPPPIRKYRISFSGDSTSFINKIICYWRLETSILNIANYTQPSNKFNLGAFWNYKKPKHIYIVDNSNNRIVQMDNMSGLNWITLGTHGSGTNQFSGPMGIAIDSKFNIYIADEGNNRIIMMNDITGAGWTVLDVAAIGAPLSIAIDSSDRIYVGFSSSIARFNDITGAGQITFGTSGHGTNQFQSANGIAVDSSNRIYVADSATNAPALARLVRTDDMVGTNWTVYTGSGPNALLGTFSVHIDSANLIYFGDHNPNHGTAVLYRMSDMIGTGLVSLHRT